MENSAASQQAPPARIRAMFDRIAPTYEAPLTRGGGTYRPWRQLVLGNIERVYAMVS